MYQMAREFGLDPLAWNKVTLKGFLQVYDMRVLEFQAEEWPCG